MPNQNELEHIAFCANLSVGIRDMDLQHKGIFVIYNKFVDEWNYSQNFEIHKIRILINDLYWYSKYHFREEEWLMRTYNYPFYREHFDRHLELLEILNSTNHKNFGIAAYVAAIDGFIDIFAEHILIYDIEYAKFIYP